MTLALERLRGAREKLRRATTMASRLARGIRDADRISTAVLFISNECNARCPYCFDTFLDHVRPPTVEKPSAPLLTVDEYALIAENLPDLHQIVLGGGEPFLRREIDEIARVFYDISGARLISIPTNGSLTRRVLEKVGAIVEHCAEATINVQISLDALGARHDELRALHRGFEKAIGLARDLAQLSEQHENLNLIINTAVTDQNLEEVEALTRYLRDSFGPGLRFHNLQYDQRLSSRLAQDEHLFERLIAIEELREPKHVDPFTRLVDRYYVSFINTLILAQLRAGRMLYQCNAGRKICVIMPGGEVSPCEPFLFEQRYERFQTANLRDYDYDYRKLAQAPSHCEQQRFIDAGGCDACPWTCATISSMEFTPANWPLLGRIPATARELAEREARGERIG